MWHSGHCAGLSCVSSQFFCYSRTIFSKKYFPVPCVMFHSFAYSVFINLLGGHSSLLLEDVHEGIV